MTGLVPVIHADVQDKMFASTVPFSVEAIPASLVSYARPDRVDDRDKPGHDGARWPCKREDS